MNKIKKYVNMLAQTDEQTIAKIAEYEKQGKLNEHLDSNIAPYIPVDKDYKYLPTNIFEKTKRAFQQMFVIKPFCKEVNKLFQTEVTGKENLKNIGSAIVVCNHINKLDCMAVRYALAPKKTYFTAAEFNNMKGFLGDMMRAGGLLPMSENFAAQKNFLATIENLLKRKTFITFFPERAEWWGYEKPRPQFDGAYHVAIKNNVPIIPVFITFKGAISTTGKNTDIRKMVVNILKPIYANPKLTLKENISTTKKQCEQEWWQCYEQFYNKKREQI